MNHEELLNKIHSKGYWRVVIRPTQFEQNKIPTLSRVRDLLRSSTVHLRGWDYPFLEEGQLRNGEDWVECSVDWGEFKEYWRFYQSGQFIHHFAMHEDYWDMDEFRRKVHPPRPERRGYLSDIGALYTITEVFEFAARMAARRVLQPSFLIQIELHGTKGRQLVNLEANRWLPDDFICEVDNISYKKTDIETELIENAGNFALDATVHIFERFNWDQPNRPILAEYQRRFLERRL